MGWGFIGGGRATYILLRGFSRAGRLPERVVVSDRDEVALDKLKKNLKSVTVTKDNTLPAKEELVFLSVPFTMLEDVLKTIKDELKKDAILISLAPKFTIKDISYHLNGFNRIVRMIPNAPSIINMGYNPICFSETIPLKEREYVKELLSTLGRCVEVEEPKLEAYVLISAASPTYFWFQFLTLQELALNLGLQKDEAKDAIYHTLKGAVELLFNSELSPDVVLDLIPLKPLKKEEKHIKTVIKDRIWKVYERIKP